MAEGRQGHAGTYLSQGCRAEGSEAGFPRLVPGLASHLLRNRIPSHRWSAASPPAPEPWALAACPGGAARGGESATGKVVGRGPFGCWGLLQATAAGTSAMGRCFIRPGHSWRQEEPGAPELQAQRPSRGASDHRPLQSSQEWGLAEHSGDRKGSWAGRRALCVPSQPWVTALGPAPCSSFPNEPPAAGRRLK